MIASRRTRLATIRYPATKLPRWGVEMNTTRDTSGSGSTNIPRRMSSRVSSERRSSSRGFRLTAFHRRSPVLMACILTSRPPWLCPIEHHSAECRVLALRIHPRHRGGDRLAQAERGQRDRIAGVVLEEPELIAAADLGIALQPVVHLGPPHEARSRAVHEDDRDEPRPIRRRGHERRPLGQRTGQPAEEAQRLELEDRHARERERQGRSRLALERHALARDRDGALVPRQVELERRRERLPADEGAAGVLDVQQGGERYPQARRDDVAAGRGVLGGRRRRRQRRAEARPAIAQRESLHFELGDRDEPVQHAIARAQLGRIERDGDLAERQRERAAGRDDLLAVLRLEGGRQGPVVQIGGEAKARIERRGS